jgi:hypothetical protein
MKMLRSRMEVRKTKQTYAYKIDLTKIGGSGDFSCPRCGTNMSPDDSAEEVYSILNTKFNKGCLWELVIRCNKCASQLHLTGFSLLHILSDHHSDSKHQKNC